MTALFIAVAMLAVIVIVARIVKHYAVSPVSPVADSTVYAGDEVWGGRLSRRAN